MMMTYNFENVLSPSSSEILFYFAPRDGLQIWLPAFFCIFSWPIHNIAVSYLPPVNQMIVFVTKNVSSLRFCCLKVINFIFKNN